jgi:hypothetical protein
MDRVVAQHCLHGGKFLRRVLCFLVRKLLFLLGLAGVEF